MKSREYYAAVQAVILAAPHVIRSDITFDEVTDSECYIRGTLTITGEIELHLAEYTVTDPEVKSHPDHLHKGNEVQPCKTMDIESVLTAAIDFIE